MKDIQTLINIVGANDFRDLQRISAIELAALQQSHYEDRKRESSKQPSSLLELEKQLRK